MLDIVFTLAIVWSNEIPVVIPVNFGLYNYINNIAEPMAVPYN